MSKYGLTTRRIISMTTKRVTDKITMATKKATTRLPTVFSTTRKSYLNSVTEKGMLLNEVMTVHPLQHLYKDTLTESDDRGTSSEGHDGKNRIFRLSSGSRKGRRKSGPLPLLKLVKKKKKRLPPCRATNFASHWAILGQISGSATETTA